MSFESRKLIEAYFEGRLDSEQIKALAEWLSSSGEAVAEFKAELARLRSVPRVDEKAEAFLEKVNTVRSRRRSKRIFRGLYIGAAVSACIAAVIVSTLYFARPVTVNETELAEEVALQQAAVPAMTVPAKEFLVVNGGVKTYTAPQSSRLTVALPDGSSVTLNKGSRLVLGGDFGKMSRPVTLDGEAFFDVAKDASRPFTIRCGNQTYVVKGTTFNIMSCAEENYSVVTLHSGALMAYIKDDTLMLTPGDELKVDESDGEIRRSRVDVAKSIEWMSDDALHFRSFPLKVVASQIGRKYGVCIHVSPSVSDILYEGVIDDEPLSVALRLLSITAPEPLAIEKLNDKDYYIRKRTI